MARTKHTARKTGPDPRQLPKKVYKGPGKSKLQKPTTPRRKFTQGVMALREIRKAVKALDNAIPRLPFQRLCRSICDKYKIDMKWQRTALECIQEAAEDFLIEFFQDAYICAAHAHRVTLMDKDLIVLRRLRYRFSKILEPVPYSDMKTFNILNIPPYRKPKKEDEVKIEDVTHERDTRTHEKAERQAEINEEREREQEQKAKEEEDHIYLEELESELPGLLSKINPKGFLSVHFYRMILEEGKIM